MRLFAITFSFAGVVLYFTKAIFEKVIVSLLLAIPIIFLNLDLDQLAVATVAILVTFLGTGITLQNKKQKYIKPNVGEQVIKSFKTTTVLLNLGLTFIFFSQISLLTFETWITNINNTLDPITKAVTKEVERSLFPQAQIISDTKKIASGIAENEELDAFLLELGVNNLDNINNIISINELGINETPTNYPKNDIGIPSPSNIIKSQIETMLKPYAEFIPIGAAILAFINYQIAINIALFITSLLIPILIFLLKLTKIISIKTETKEVQIYEI